MLGIPLNTIVPMFRVRTQVRFMIMAEHELCEQTVVGADQEAFNSHLNLEQVNKVRGALGVPFKGWGLGWAPTRRPSARTSTWLTRCAAPWEHLFRVRS